MKILPGLVACTVVLGAALSASAEPKNVASVAPLYQRAPGSRAPAPPRALPPPQPDLGPAPDSPAPVHYRHGFYLRGALGGSYLTDAETASDGQSDKLSGGGYSLDVLLGGSPVPGLALGGGFSATITDKPRVQADGQTVQGSNSLGFATLSGFADWYPMPSNGLHILAMGGFAQLRVSDPDGNSVGDTATGPGFGIGAGYEWSVGRHWGLGAMARYTYASLAMTTAGVTYHESLSSPQLLLTGTLY